MNDYILLCKLYFINEDIHLISDRAIFNKDKFINIKTGATYTANGRDQIYYSKRDNPDMKKVEATTDKSLGLPLIPETFIEAINLKKKAPDEVVLTYTYEVFGREVHYDNRANIRRYSDDGSECNVLPNMNKVVVQTRPDGTATVTRTKHQTFSKEDLEVAFNAGKKYDAKKGETLFDSWFKRNF